MSTDLGARRKLASDLRPGDAIQMKHGSDAVVRSVTLKRGRVLFTAYQRSEDRTFTFDLLPNAVVIPGNEAL
ncbi:MAG: hypothetical protein ACXVGB_00245 [Mycobacteriaceae bacterium]